MNRCRIIAWLLGLLGVVNQALALAGTGTFLGDTNVVSPAIFSTIEIAGSHRITTNIAGCAGGLATAQGLDNANSFRNITVATRDIAYDPITRKVYASVPGSAPGAGNQILPIDPESGALEPGVPTGNEPGKLVVAPGGGRLYVVVETNSMLQRIDLLSRSIELSFSLETNTPVGVYTVEDFEALPGSSNSLAVLRLQYGFNAEIAVYDDGVPRPNVGDAAGDLYREIIEASSDGESVYFQSYGGRGFPRFRVEADGVSADYVNTTITPVFQARDWRAVENRLFGSDGVVIDPLVPAVVDSIPSIPLNSLLTYDSTVRRVYFLVPSGANWIVQAYEAASLIPAGTMTISNVVGTPSSLIRWGQSGLAFRTDSNQLFLIKTSLVPTNPPADLSLSLALSDLAYYVGSNITQTLVISNAGPYEANDVVWSNTLPAGVTVVSATASIGTLNVTGNMVRGTVGTMSSQGLATVTIVFRPNSSGIVTSSAYVDSSASEVSFLNNSSVLALWVQSPGSAPSVSTLSLVTKDLVPDPVRDRLYASIGKSAPLLSNSVLVIDPNGGPFIPVRLGSDPGRLAISADGQFLYVGLDNGAGVRRLDLATLTVDLSFPIPNSRRVLDMAVCPTNSDLVAVSRHQDEAITVYDRGVSRPNELRGYVGLLAFSDTTGELYTCNEFYSNVPLYRIDAGPSGVAILDSQPAKPSHAIEMKFSGGILYYGRGMVLDPRTRRVLAKLPLPPNAANAFDMPVEPDAASRRVYFLTGRSPNRILRAFDTQQWLEVGAETISGLSSPPTRLWRFGSNGFTFRTDSQVFIVRSTLVPTNGAADLSLDAAVSAPRVLPGEVLTYTLAVTNVGPNVAAGVVLTQAFSLTVTGIIATVTEGAVTNDSSFLTWQIPVLGVGAGARLTVSAQAAQTGTLVARSAVVGHSSNDPKLNNNLGLNVAVIGSPTTNEIREVALATRELIFDPFRRRIYASVPTSEPFFGNSVISINPVTARIEPLFFAGSEPNQLALSDDGRYVYVSLDGTMGARRVDLLGEQPALEFPFSLDEIFNAFDIKVQPGHPETLAVSRVSTRTNQDYPTDVALFDHGVVRTTTAGRTKSIEFSPDGERIYGSITFGVGSGFIRLSAGAQGISVLDVNGSFSGDYDLTLHGELLYSALGRVIDPTAPTLLATFGVNGSVAPDSGVGRIFQIPLSDTVTELRAYAMNSYQALGGMPLPGARPFARHLIRCGGDRLAFRTDPGGQLILLRTSLAVIDSDGDSMSDDWEMAFFNSMSGPSAGPHDDFDADSISNLQEFLDGTDPTDHTNLLRIKHATWNAGVVTLRFHGVPGRSYQLERAATGDGTWSGAGPTLHGHGLMFTVTDTPPQDAATQFYRLRQVP